MATLELSPTERGALIALELQRGDTLKRCDVARRYGIAPNSADRILERLARSLPLYREDGRGTWRMLKDSERVG